MLHAVWTARSLRFWVAVGMTAAILPLCLSAVGGYIMLDRGVIVSLHDIAMRQREQNGPVQDLRLLLWDAVLPVDEFVDEGDARQPAAYRALRQRIEAGFAAALDGLRRDPEPYALVQRARDDWTAADALATEALSVRRPPGDPHEAELMDRFHGQIEAAVDRLGAVYEDLAVEWRRDHDTALRAYERSQWLAGVAAAVSALMIAVGVFTIGRMMRLSVDRLVDGAERFAAGDRNHRIEVAVPPELCRVADEFNRTIARIHEAEEVLAEQARRDVLTRLLNRRAFDEALAEAFARLQRLGEPVALLLIDIDHFKRINDTLGHAAGDEVLRAVAQALAADVRTFDRIFRYGGEEFAAILYGVDLASAEQTAERLRQSIAAAAVPISDGAVGVTISIGIAMADGESEPSVLIETADAALYRAKEGGRNRVEVAAAA